MKYLPSVPYFTNVMSSLQFYQCCNDSVSFLGLGNISLWIFITSPYPSICWWTLMLIPCFGYGKYCCSKHTSAHVCAACWSWVPCIPRRGIVEYNFLQDTWNLYLKTHLQSYANLSLLPRCAGKIWWFHLTYKRVIHHLKSQNWSSDPFTSGLFLLLCVSHRGMHVALSLVLVFPAPLYLLQH